MRYVEDVSEDNIKLKSLSFKQGFIQYCHLPAMTNPPGRVFGGNLYGEPSTFFRLGSDGYWVDHRRFSVCPIKCHSFKELFTAEEVWSKVCLVNK